MEKIVGNGNVEKSNSPRLFTKLDYSKFPRGSSTLYDSFDDQNIVIRKSFVGGIDDRNSKGMDYSEKEKYLRDRANQFKEIINSLGIRMAKTDYLIGDSLSSPKDPALFGVTERINGEGLDKINDWGKEIVAKIDDIYAKAISAFIDSYQRNGKAWHDLRNGQFIYGKTEEDEKPDIYLVDADPAIVDWDDPDFEEKYHMEKKAVFLRKINFFEREIDDLERSLSESEYNFIKARKMIDRAHVEILNKF
ncbi:MAG: hypothetical protein WC878_04960 [Candidatus Paceibacterota bacterium]|jgi:hypothetical protein